MADLLPCPFCGTMPELRTTYGSEIVGYANSYTIQCPRCFASHGATDRDNPKGGYALSTGKDEAFARWNRRALPAVTPAVKVKPLYWELRDVWFARCPIMGQDFSVLFEDGKYWCAQILDLPGYMSAANMKAAVDEWRAARIQSALDLTPAPVTLADALALPEIKALVEAARRYRAAILAFDGRGIMGEKLREAEQASIGVDAALRRIAEARHD